MKKNIVLDLSFEFALEIIEFAELLENNRKYVIANQILKSRTSIGANIREAQSAESKNDFIHKFKIADKEIRETKYWLMLCRKAKNYPNPDEEIINKLESLKKISSKIIISSKQKL